MQDIYIVLAITIFMIISFMINKVPFGVTTMTCCVLLVLTGYYTPSEAFSGLSNKTTILVAGTFVMASAFGKTSLINRIRSKMSIIKEKSGFVLILFLYVIAIILSQLMGRTAVLPRKDEIVITVVFLAVMVSFLFSNKLGGMINVVPAVGVLVLIYAKSISVKEAVNGLTSDMVWMIAGVLVVSDALGSSGVGELIGKGVLNILGQQPSGWFVLAVFTVASIIMTTFMSNTGTAAVLIPIGASTAMTAGMDPRGIVLVIAISSVLAIAFPSGSAECALAFAAGKHNPVKVLKYTVPYLVIATITLVLSVNFFFPVYG